MWGCILRLARSAGGHRDGVLGCASPLNGMKIAERENCKLKVELH
jgi:hypothetical protein